MLKKAQTVMNNPPTGGPNMANSMWQLKNKTIIHMK
jgi:hypothetical protein